MTHSHRGSTYVAVLSITALMSLTAIAGVASVRQRRATIDDQAKLEAARLLARSGIDIALQEIATNDDWRTDMAGTAWAKHATPDGGTLLITVTDPDDNDLTDDDTHPARITATAAYAEAIQTVSLDLAPPPSAGHPALASAVHAGVLFLFTERLASARPITANVIEGEDGDITTTTQVGNATVTPATYEPIDTAYVLSELLPLATTITASDIGENSLSDTYLGPEYNPFGDTNARGVYVIDAEGDDFTIDNVFVRGTLILMNANRAVSLDNAVRLRPADPSLPTLVVVDNVRVNLRYDEMDPNTLIDDDDDRDDDDGDRGDADTVESIVRNETNGSGDLESLIEGLVFFAGDATVSSSPTIHGTLVCNGELTFEGEHTFSPGADHVTYPPVGFDTSTSATLAPDTSSWRRVVDR